MTPTQNRIKLSEIYQYWKTVRDSQDTGGFGDEFYQYAFSYGVIDYLWKLYSCGGQDDKIFNVEKLCQGITLISNSLLNIPPMTVINKVLYGILELYFYMCNDYSRVNFVGVDKVCGEGLHAAYLHFTKTTINALVVKVWEQDRQHILPNFYRIDIELDGHSSDFPGIKQ